MTDAISSLSQRRPRSPSAVSGMSSAASRCRAPSIAIALRRCLREVVRAARPALDAYDVIVRVQQRRSGRRHRRCGRRGRAALAAPGRGAPMKRVLIAAVRGYQYALRPMLGANCRFYPSCSDYASEAIERHGALRGSWLAARRAMPLPPVSSGRLRPGALSAAATRCFTSSTATSPRMDTQRLLLLVIFSFSGLFLWEAWQREHAPPVPPVAGDRRQERRPNPPTCLRLRRRASSPPASASQAAVPGSAPGARRASGRSDGQDQDRSLHRRDRHRRRRDLRWSRSTSIAIRTTPRSRTSRCRGTPSGPSSRRRD